LKQTPIVAEQMLFSADMPACMHTSINKRLFIGFIHVISQDVHTEYITSIVILPIYNWSLFVTMVVFVFSVA